MSRFIVLPCRCANPRPGEWMKQCFALVLADKAEDRLVLGVDGVKRHPGVKDAVAAARFLDPAQGREQLVLQRAGYAAVDVTSLFRVVFVAVVVELADFVPAIQHREAVVPQRRASPRRGSSLYSSPMAKEFAVLPVKKSFRYFLCGTSCIPNRARKS